MCRRNAILLIAVMLCHIALKSQGVLTWLETEHDFGMFNESEGRVKCVFRAVNTGNAPVVIERVVPTCGCTTGEYTRTPIAVGDTAIVTLTYHATGRVGSFNKIANVYTNTAQRKMALRIRGNVLASKETIEEMYPYHIGALYMDRRTIPFGVALEGSSRMGYIGAYNNSADTITVSFENVPKWVEMEAFPMQVPPFGLCTISGFFNAYSCTEWGLNTADIKVNVEQNGSESKGVIDVIGTVTEDFSKLSKKDLEKAPIAHISDEVLDFGTIGAHADVVRREFTLTNMGRSTLLIRRVYCTDKFVGVATDAKEVKPGASCTVSVAVNAAEISDAYLNARLTVITNDPAHSWQEVRLVGIKEK